MLPSTARKSNRYNPGVLGSRGNRGSPCPSSVTWPASRQTNDTEASSCSRLGSAETSNTSRCLVVPRYFDARCRPSSLVAKPRRPKCRLAVVDTNRLLSTPVAIASACFTGHRRPSTSTQCCRISAGSHEASRARTCSAVNSNCRPSSVKRIVPPGPTARRPPKLHPAPKQHQPSSFFGARRTQDTRGAVERRSVSVASGKLLLKG